VPSSDIKSDYKCCAKIAKQNIVEKTLWEKSRENLSREQEQQEEIKMISQQCVWHAFAYIRHACQSINQLQCKNPGEYSKI
jgi:hypothetical protein